MKKLSNRSRYRPERLTFKCSKCNKESTVKQLVELDYTRDIVKDIKCVSEKYPLLHKGKVRDIYDMGNDLLAISHSDRLSSFDRHICNVLGKGHILTESSVFWFNKIKDSFLHPILPVTKSRFLKILSLLSLDPKPQFKLS